MERELNYHETVNYQAILNDPDIIGAYAKIDAANRLSFNHGMKHIKKVINNMDKLTDTLGIVGQEKDDLMIAAALHDIGQVESQGEHGPKGAIFTQHYLGGRLPEDRVVKIADAIHTHSQRQGLDDLPLFSIMLAFADKMDFTRERIETDWQERSPEKYHDSARIYSHVKKVDFNVDSNDLVVSVATDGEIRSRAITEDPGFWVSAHKYIVALATKLGRDSKVLIDGIEVQK